jgi:hypothetical protein
VKSSVTTSITQSEFVTELQKKTVDSRLQVLIYCISYAKTFRDGKFYGYNNNYANITLTTNYGTNVEYFINREYSCVNISNSTGEPTSQPIANFNNIGKFFDFMIARLSPNVSRVFGETTGLGITKYYVCYWPVSDVSVEYYDSHLSEYTTLNKTFDNALKSAGDAGLNVETAKELRKQNDKKQTTTPTPNNLNTTTTVLTPCSPPTISSFTPLTGVSKTILYITGNNLDEVTGATINNVLTTTGITIIDEFNITVVVPFSNTTVAQGNPIRLSGSYGTSSTASNFTYNPAQVTPTKSNLINTNTQPQQNGVTILTSQTQLLTRDITDNLTVIVNPNASLTNTWTMQDTVVMTVSVYDTVNVNNSNTLVLNNTFTTTITGYVSNNQFFITNSNVGSILVNQSIKTTQRVYVKFTIIAVPTNKATNPQNVQQSFNFRYQ